MNLHLRKSTASAFVSVLMIFFLPFSAYAFDPSMDPQQVLASIGNVDCNLSPVECRYLAAVEVAAYVDACPAALGRKFGSPSQWQEKLMRGWLQSWTSLNPPELKAAVLSDDNKLRRWMAATFSAALEAATSTDVGIKCSQLGTMRDGTPAEVMSKIIRGTTNYGQWDHSEVYASAE